MSTTDGSGGASGTNNLNMVLTIGEGETGAIKKLFFNDTVVWEAGVSSGSTTTLSSGGFRLDNYIETKYGSTYIAYYPGTAGQTVDTTLQASIGASVWTANSRLRGIAYLALKLPFDTDYNGAAPEVTIEFDGKKVRKADALGTIVSGANQNPADVLLDYLGNTTYGKGIPDSAIDLTSFAAARTYFDNSGSPKFKVNGFLDTNNTLFDNIGDITQVCNSMLIYTNGKYKFKFQKANESSTFTFTEDNIIGDFDIQLPSKQAKFNKVILSYGNLAKGYNDDQVIVSSSTFLGKDNATVLIGEMESTMITEAAQATQLATWTMNNSRFQMGVNFIAAHSAIDVVAGDIISITHPVIGFSAKKFRVNTTTLQEDNTIEFSVQQYESSIQI